MSLRWLDELDPVAPGKAGTLAKLVGLGLPVPLGFVVPMQTHAVGSGPLDAAIERVLADGAAIVRSAFAGEDRANQSGAGLGHSIGDLTTVGDVRSAIASVGAPEQRAYIDRYRGSSSPHDLVIVQRQIPRRAVLVVAVTEEGLRYVEVQAGHDDALAAGHTPAYAGRLERWPHPARSELAGLVDTIVEGFGPTEHGLDLELVLDADDRLHVVQARPITAPLHPEFAAFQAEVQAEGRWERLRSGRWVLDAEHNPAPLSVAHAWLMDWLAAHEPRAGGPTAFAGWLYVQTLPRHLDGSGDAAVPDLRPVLERLLGELVVEARARLEAVRSRLRSARGSAIAAELPLALAAFHAMIDAYVAELVPARSRALRALQRLHADRSAPLSLRDRSAFADVLPVAWDIASPTLAELSLSQDGVGGAPPEIPDDPVAAVTLLGEWDDHLFALGLAPLRAVWLAVGAELGVGEAVFGLGGDELEPALHEASDVLSARLAERAAMRARQAELRPPLVVEDGLPVPTPPSTRLRGVPIGQSFRGPLTHRRDLADLLQRPPSPQAIVVLPALTAQAALVLHEVRVRAVCCEHGGAMTHAALMCRELGLSALLGCRGCVDLPEGLVCQLDTKLARLRPLAP